MKFLSKFAACILASVCLSANAIPIASAGTEGYSVVVANTGDVIATFQGSTANYSDDLYLNGLKIFNNHVSPVGSMFNLGSFAGGTELIFQLRVNNTGQLFYTGDASRNPDLTAHARVESDWLVAGTSLVSFEDLLFGPFNYNDLSFSFTNTIGAVDPTNPIPEPGSLALILLGLGALGIVYRRKQSQSLPHI
nr:PEP-CTERM sorting domain-containing protein [uncultured Albidiferax sp.]